MADLRGSHSPSPWGWMLKPQRKHPRQGRGPDLLVKGTAQPTDRREVPMGLEPFSRSSQKVNSELKGNRLRNCTNINQKFPSTAEWTNEMFHSHKNNKTKTVGLPPHIPLTDMCWVKRARREGVRTEKCHLSEVENQAKSFNNDGRQKSRDLWWGINQERAQGPLWRAGYIRFLIWVVVTCYMWV